ncbi:U-reduvitoxin-Pr21-like [Ruditapes philippinarum]|uniref:U-reduvitoxin-Pr21-like n=1 Tax=Ruditapes philippinarum TaxID=129788 RepID=UPI00295BA691|nr:U-reduvitoxin-Pr21-like [Ruditapes philippinarum]
MRQFVICALVLVLTIAYVQSVCVHNGIKYKEGERYLDDCNRCKCGKGGKGLCTRKGCPPKVCTYNGKKYGAGEQFMDSDNCNGCTCSADGTVGCTEMACI